MFLNKFCFILLGLAIWACALLPYPIAGWFLLINMLTLVIYGVDKLAARKAWQRIPEATLLFFGLLGGWPGAVIGQQFFRHKTIKQPFKTYFMISMVVNFAVVMGIYWFYV